MDVELERIIGQVSTVIKEVGAFIKEQNGKVSPDLIEQKSLNNLVSYVDKTAERRLVEALSKILPEAAFLTEEETVEQAEGEWKWIIDPLDGTTNFLHQIPMFAVSVALVHNDVIKCGWVYDVMHQGMYYAWEKGGAYLNGTRIRVSKQTDFEQSLLVTGFPYGNPDFMEKYVDVFHHLIKNTRGIRRLGSAALDLVYVASGKFDAFYEYKLSPWDVAGGAIIVREAGGVVMDFEGGNDYLYGGKIVATNARITRALLNVIQEKFLQ